MSDPRLIAFEVDELELVRRALEHWENHVIEEYADTTKEAPPDLDEKLALIARTIRAVGE